MPDSNTASQFVTEPARQTPVAASVDVVVVGGGPSGIIAAVAAAREGAHTLIVERYDHLGGYFAAGPGGQSVGISFQDMTGKIIIGGLPWEFMERLFATGGGTAPQDVDTAAIAKAAGNVSAEHQWHSRHIGKTKPKVEYEAVKSLAFDMIEESGGRILLNAWTSAAIVEDGALRGIIVETKSGRQAILAKVVVDCTGDADIHALAGAPFEISPKQVMYQISRQYKVAIRDDKGRPVIIGEAGSDFDYGDGTDMWDLTRAEIEIRKRAHEKLARMRERDEYRDAYLFGTGESPLLGVRETRRIIGEYMLTEDDIVEARKFSDAVAKSANPIDMHKSGAPNENRSVKGDFHDIPYRCLVPKAIDNLLAAGRCISATHVAEAAIRKVPVCMATGQAAGVAAAIAANLGTSPRALMANDAGHVRRVLRDRGAIV